MLPLTLRLLSAPILMRFVTVSVCLLCLSHNAAYSAHPHRASSKAPSESQASRRALQKTLQQQIQDIENRKNQTQRASEKARLSSHQVAVLKKRQDRLTAQLTRTQDALKTVNDRISQLDSQDDILSAQQDKQQRDALSLLPSLLFLQNAPEHNIRPLAPSSSPAPDPALALPLLRARLIAAQHETARLEQERTALHYHQTQLDQNAQRIQSQQQLQEKRHVMSQEEARKAASAQQEAERNLSQSRALLRQSQESMRSLTAAISRLALQEQAERRRLKKQALVLRRKHRHAQAHDTETTLHALDNGPGLKKGQGFSPVQGTITTRWGQNTEAGPATGLTYRAPPSASVRAPCSGRVLFTGDFRSFGPMVILDCGHSQRFVLAGLGHITASADQPMKRQASLGTMPPQGGSLFVQFRRGTNIANPAPFLSVAP